MKIKYVFTALLAGATLMSCNDYLDVESESQYNDKVVFSNTPLAENTVISIYSWFAATNSHRARYMPYYGMNTVPSATSTWRSLRRTTSLALHLQRLLCQQLDGFRKRP